MDKTADNFFIKYLHPGYSYLFVAIALILFGMITITTMILPVLCAGCAALLFWLWSSSSKAFQADLEAARQSGNLSAIASDFSRGQPFFGKKICLGQLCIYGRRCGRILYYRDVRRFYIRNHNGYQYSTCELKNGNHISLCQLRVSRSLDQYTALLQIGNAIRSHNPSIAVDIL